MKTIAYASIAFLLLFFQIGCSELNAQDKSADNGNTRSEDIAKKDASMKELSLATFGGGCFWCTEAVFLECKGVESVVSGYSGGKVQNPTYQQVCSGMTGHAEVIQIEFDPEKVTFEQLMEIHLKTHDPTTLNRQGNDFGTQYRSAIFYHNKEQKESSEKIIQALNQARVYRNPIVTEVTQFTKFWPAEDYHQNYLAENPRQPYCRAIVKPKVVKFRKVFKDMLKDKEDKE